MNITTNITDVASIPPHMVNIDWDLIMPRYCVGQEVGILKGKYKYRVGKIIATKWSSSFIKMTYRIKLYDNKKRLMKEVIDFLPLEIEPANKNKK